MKQMKTRKITVTIIMAMLVIMAVSAIALMQKTPESATPVSIEEISTDESQGTSYGYPIEGMLEEKVPVLDEKYADDYIQSNLMHTIPEEHQKLLLEQGIDWVASCEPSTGQYIASNGSYLFEIDLVNDTWVFYLENEEPMTINQFFDKAYSSTTVIE